MERLVQIDATAAVHQASSTVHSYLLEPVHAMKHVPIDPKKNPDAYAAVLSALVRAAAADYHSYQVAVNCDQAMERAGHFLERLDDLIEKIGGG